jgi:hypothetical protein
MEIIVDQTTAQVVAVEQVVQVQEEIAPLEVLVVAELLLIQFLHQVVQGLQDQRQV